MGRGVTAKTKKLCERYGRILFSREKQSHFCNQTARRKSLVYRKPPSEREVDATKEQTEGACGTMKLFLAIFQPIFPCCRTLPHPTPSGAPSRREPTISVTFLVAIWGSIVCSGSSVVPQKHTASEAYASEAVLYENDLITAEYRNIRPTGRSFPNAPASGDEGAALPRLPLRLR